MCVFKDAALDSLEVRVYGIAVLLLLLLLHGLMVVVP